MITTEDRLTGALESAVEGLEFTLDAASVDFEVETSPNTNQYIVIFADGARHAYVTAESSWDDTPMVFVDIYSVDAYGEENWVRGDMEVAEAIPYIINA
jgi:hypothetical protein|nr:MAG TPA: hypothetical protein [Caudoviricetes sp.]